MSPALLFALIVFVILPSVAGLVHLLRTWSERDQFPPPGELINIGTHKLHFIRMGNIHQAPTVVLEAGGGGFSLEWEMVQRRIAQFAPVVAYDRAGYGWSDDSPNARTPEQIATELHSLLTCAEVPAPYILVGHSIGGEYVRRFALCYPHLVAGIVLVDSVHPHQWFEPVISQQSQIRQQQMMSVMARLGLLRMAARSKFATLDMADDVKNAHAAKVSRGAYQTVIREVRDVNPSRNPIRAMLGDIPLIVLTQTPTKGGLSKVVQRLQAELPSMSSNSQHRIAENSTHYIHLDAPELVVDAVRELYR
jgi:pimeloyl-ACP methyl ester carboxylesterase